MKYWKTLKKIFGKKVNIFYVLFLSFLIFWIMRIVPHWDILWQLLVLDSVSWSSFWNEFNFRTLGIMASTDFWNNILAFIFPLLISTNIIFFKELYLKQEFILKSKSIWASLSGMFFGLFGVGCAACSGLLLAPVISFFGLGWVFKLMPYGGQELAYVGVILIIVSNIYLIKKISDPVVCSK